MTLEIKRLHLASLQGMDGRRWPQHVLDDWRVVNRSVADALAELDMSPADIGLVIGDAAYTPRQYADPASDSLPPGQASDVGAWRESVRRIRSLDPGQVHFCHHTDIVHS